ncbi:unnamed protein product, partial [Linum tenue]
SSQVKRKRGTTRCKEIWALSKGEKVHVRINRYGQPVGSKAKKLGYFLGTLARNGAYAPLRYADWRNMPAHYKTEMWDLVQEKFDIDPLVEPWIMSSLDSKWRNFKNKVKNRWFGKKERDGRVLNDDWTWLLEFWSSNKAVRREIVAKENRSKVKSAHTLGTKSYACKRDEMAESTPDKVEPTPAQVYVVAHVRKNGTPLNAQVAQVIVTPNDILNTYLPHHQGLSSKTGTTVARNNSSQMVQNRTFSFLDYALNSSQNVDSSSQQRTEQVSSAAAIGHESQVTSTSRNGQTV